jgi:hypothetical protein
MMVVADDELVASIVAIDATVAATVTVVVSNVVIPEFAAVAVLDKDVVARIVTFVAVVFELVVPVAAVPMVYSAVWVSPVDAVLIIMVELDVDDMTGDVVLSMVSVIVDMLVAAVILELTVWIVAVFVPVVPTVTGNNVTSTVPVGVTLPAVVLGMLAELIVPVTTVDVIFSTVCVSAVPLIRLVISMVDSDAVTVAPRVSVIVLRSNVFVAVALVVNEVTDVILSDVSSDNSVLSVEKRVVEVIDAVSVSTVPVAIVDVAKVE